MTTLGPRLVVAGVASGVGKTTIAAGLMAAMRHAGLVVANAKVGPDFIDPGYHSLATGRPPRNLDPWLCGIDTIPSLAANAAAGANLLMIEGVMGLFDGSDDGTPSSTADVAAVLDAPVVLVVNASSMGGSIAAVVRGFRDHDPRIRIGGVICNRVGSPRHAQLLTDALASLGVDVLGCIPRDDSFTWRERHLGLVPVAEGSPNVTTSLHRLAETLRTHIDLEAIESLARSAPPIDAPNLPPCDPVGRFRVAVAAGPAFGFTYWDNIEAMEAGGAEVVPFDPRHADRLPDAVDGLFAGGGLPEIYGAELAANRPLLDDVRRRVRGGLPTWAECGGMLWLADRLDGRAMVGAVPATASLGRRLQVGYRQATVTTESVVGPAGTTFRGHEFHYSTCEPPGAAVTLSSRYVSRSDGFATPTLLATYVHHHAGGDPSLIRGFLRTVAQGQRR